ncbi:MAG: transglycosylase SLT domain-containing protein, partial [Myxococcota bacterium]
TATATAGAKKGKAKAKKGKRRPKPRAPGSAPGAPNAQVRQALRGHAPDHAVAPPREAPELAMMCALDRALFPPPPPTTRPEPRAETVDIDGSTPRAQTSGLPAPATPVAQASPASSSSSPDWLATLARPDFPVRLDAQVVRYLRYYRDDARGRKLIAALARKSGRYIDALRRALAAHGLPRDLCWLAMVESGYDATIHSHAGAAGLWQFMPATGRIYGLTVNRRVDERLDPERSTVAAARHLHDLHQRFGSWALAFGAYNMGYGGMLAAIRRFNTNDFWRLTRIEAGLPYETARYVPKIMALAIAMNNCKAFGCDGMARDPARPFGDEGADALSVAPGVTLDDVADAADVGRDALTDLNPHLIGSRLPPLETAPPGRKGWTVYVPVGKGAKAKGELPAIQKRRRLGTHRVRLGESTATLAAAYGTSVGVLEAWNDLRRRESARPGRVLFVPRGRKPKSPHEIAATKRPVAVVPRVSFSPPDRRRVFYAPVFGDTVEQVARACGVAVDDVVRWNRTRADARLQEGMHLQLFLPRDAQPADVWLWEEADVTVTPLGSEAFFERVVSSRGRARRKVTVREGDTWRALGRRYGCSVGYLERINRRSRYEALRPGDTIIVYAQKSRLEAIERAEAERKRAPKP